MRTDRRVHTVTMGQLALDRAETAALSDVSGITIPEALIDELWQRTEGWPVALYLVILALREAAPEDRIETVRGFAGDDRLIVEYVREELLDTLPRRLRTFLLHVSILDELNADACDAILERRDSARVLENSAVFDAAPDADRSQQHVFGCINSCGTVSACSSPGRIPSSVCSCTSAPMVRVGGPARLRGAPPASDRQSRCHRRGHLARGARVRRHRAHCDSQAMARTLHHRATSNAASAGGHRGRGALSPTATCRPSATGHPSPAPWTNA